MATHSKEVATQGNGNYADLGSYLVLKTDPSEVQEVILENTGGGQFSMFDLDHIRVPAGGGLSWEIETINGHESLKEIQAVVVGVRNFRSYWQIGFDESGGGTPPDCTAPPPRPDGVQMGIGNPGGECAICPMNEFLTADKGEGKACKEMQALYLLQSDTFIPSILFVPPSSLKPIKKYMLGLAAKGLRYFSVLSAFGLRKERSKTGITYSQIEPHLVRPVHPDDMTRLAAYVQALKTSLGGSPMSGVIAVPRSAERAESATPTA